MSIELRWYMEREFVEKYDDHEARWFQVPIDSKPVLQYREPDGNWKNVPNIIERVVK